MDEKPAKKSKKKMSIKSREREIKKDNAKSFFKGL